MPMPILILMNWVALEINQCGLDARSSCTTFIVHWLLISLLHCSLPDLVLIHSTSVHPSSSFYCLLLSLSLSLFLSLSLSLSSYMCCCHLVHFLCFVVVYEQHPFFVISLFACVICTFCCGCCATAAAAPPAPPVTPTLLAGLFN